MISLDEFNAYVRALTVHDWWYEFSSDQQTYQAGRKRQQELETMAMSHDVYKQVMKAFVECKFGEGSETFRNMQCNETIDALRRQVRASQQVIA